MCLPFASPSPPQKKQPGESSYTYSTPFNIKEKKQNGLPWRRTQIWGFVDTRLYNQGVFFDDRSKLTFCDIPIPVFFVNPPFGKFFYPSVRWGWSYFQRNYREEIL
jgi:hypothetical protein